jgi:hypothetical protein
MRSWLAALPAAGLSSNAVQVPPFGVESAYHEDAAIWFSFGADGGRTREAWTAYGCDV